MSDAETRMRWDPYVFLHDAEFNDFWRGHLASRDRRLLLVMGRGFDIRTLEAAARLNALGADLTIWLLAYDNGLNDSERRRKLTEANYQGLLALLPETKISHVNISIGGSSGSPASSRNTKVALEKAGDATQFDDVIVDISAMPRIVAMTSVAVLLNQLDDVAAAGGKKVNLHVTAAESVTADLGAAKGTLQEQVSMVVGFSGKLTSQTTDNWPRVWFPILGENQHVRLDRIQAHIDPDEICPVVPFPSRQPRRGDEIIAEHRAILFDEFQIEPANILLTSEYNPFEAYKQLFRAMDRYRRTLNKLGGCKAFVSPISSKLLSIGALLACYDHRFGIVNGDRLDVGIAYVETAVYGDPVQQPDIAFELYSMWIRGEWEE